MQFRVRIGARRGMWFGSAVRAGIADPTSGCACISAHICEADISAVQWGEFSSHQIPARSALVVQTHSRAALECPLTFGWCVVNFVRTVVSTCDGPKLDQFSLKDQECDDDVKDKSPSSHQGFLGTLKS